MPTATGLSRGTLATLFVHAVEKQSKEVIDICRKEIKALNAFKALGIYGETDAAFAEIDPFIETKDVPVTTFATGIEALPTTIVQGAHAKYVEFCNYTAPVGMTWVEEQKTADPYKIIDLARTRTYKAGTAIGEQLERALFYGSLSDSLAIQGLEQIFKYTRGVDTALGTMDSVAECLAAARWQLRQTVDTYFGVSRTAFTADDVGGSHLENVAVGASSALIGATLDISLSSGVASDGLKILNKVYDSCTYGDDGPDFMVSTYPPFQQYTMTVPGLIRYMPSGSEQIPGVNLGAGVVRFRNAWWTATEQAAASGLVSGTTAGYNMIYGLVSKFHKFEVTRKGNFHLTDFVRGPGSLAPVAQLIFRGQQKNNNPRTGFVLMGFGN